MLTTVSTYRPTRFIGGYGACTFRLLNFDNLLMQRSQVLCTMNIRYYQQLYAVRFGCEFNS